MKNLFPNLLKNNNKGLNGIPRYLDKNLFVPEEILERYDAAIASVESPKSLNFYKYGIDGENNIANVLKESNFSLFILRDFFPNKSNDADIDFIVITPKIFFIIESKYMGKKWEITIDSHGQFYKRDKNTNKPKEPFNKNCETPYHQNQAHIKMLKDMYNKSSILQNKLKDFEERLQNTIVFSRIGATYSCCNDTPPDITDCITTVNDLIDYIRKKYENSNLKELSTEKMEQIFDELLRLSNKARKPHYLTVLEDYEKEQKEMKNIPLQDDETIKQRLKDYNEKMYHKNRAKTPKNYPAFCIYPFGHSNDSPEIKKTLSEIIEQKPQDLRSLKNVTGIGPGITTKYGEDILKIIKGEAVTVDGVEI